MKYCATLRSLFRDPVPENFFTAILTITLFNCMYRRVFDAAHEARRRGPDDLDESTLLGERKGKKKYCPAYCTRLAGYFYIPMWVYRDKFVMYMDNLH